MAKLPRFLIHAETYDKLPATVLSAIQDETRTSLYGARLLLDAYAMGVQDQLVELGKLVAEGRQPPCPLCSHGDLEVRHSDECPAER